MKLNYNRKILQEQNPFHYTTLTHSPAPLINDSSSSSTAAAEVSQHFKPNSSPFDTSMALTILVLLTALFFMSFFSFYIRRYADDASTTTGRSSTNNAVHQPSRRNSTLLNSQFAKGLDPSLIQSLPTISYGGDAKHRMECSICLTEFEEKETVKLIPHCRHAFHPPCIDTWLASHESCPLCRSTELFDEVGSNVVEYNNGDGVGRRSTDGDEYRRDVGTVIGVRRTCSYSSIRDRLSLPRSNSF